MPRFNDKWVVDRTMFEFTMGGSCSCVACVALFHPGGLKGVIDDMSDLETDAANAEFNAAKESPWPPQMRDEVWADRVRLRHQMKKEMKKYADFMTKIGGKGGLKRFLMEELGPASLRRIIQMPRAEVTEKIRSHYDIHSGLRYVMCAVVEQVANFEITKLPPDGRADFELAFEDILKYDRRGGFILPIAIRNEETRKFDIMNEETLDILVDMIDGLGGPKLLHRAPKKQAVDDEEDEDEDDEQGGADDAAEDNEAPAPGQDGSSFRADRRIIRLLIVRYWADQIIQKYESSHEKKEEEKEQSSGSREANNQQSSSGEVNVLTRGVKSLSTNE